MLGRRLEHHQHKWNEDPALGLQRFAPAKMASMRLLTMKGIRMDPKRRKLMGLLWLSFVAVLLSACGGSGTSSSPDGVAPAVDASLSTRNLAPLHVSSKLRAPTADEKNRLAWLWVVQDLTIENDSSKHVAIEKPAFGPPIADDYSIVMTTGCAPDGSGKAICSMSQEFTDIAAHGKTTVSVDFFQGMPGVPQLRPGSYSKDVELRFLEGGNNMFNPADSGVQTGTITFKYDVKDS
jgi:hypothetical protein